jgi:PBP1b-binding outer membrane lipoprotein LpoB
MKIYLLILSSILIITSCDKVEGPYITDPDSYINPYKKVLIEDFTGHLCANCPGAAREISAIHDLYGDQIIALAIHASTDFARPYSASQSGFQYDFRTKWGEEWDNIFGASAIGLPRGMVNRIGGQSPTLGKNEWAAVVANELQKEISFKINISSNTESITVTSDIEKNTNGSFNLVICLVESNIINWQKDGADNVEDYEHNHVLRSVLIDNAMSSSTNFVVGEQIVNTIEYDLTTLEQFNEDYSSDAEEGNGNAGGWDATNMSIIAFIYNTNTNEVVQVEEANLNQ